MGDGMNECGKMRVKPTIRFVCRSKCTKNKLHRAHVIARADPLSHLARTPYFAHGHPDFTQGEFPVFPQTELDVGGL